MRGFFTRLTIRQKLTLVYVPLVLLAIVLCFAGFTAVTRKKMTTQVCEEKVKLLKTLSDKQETIYNSMITISNSYLLNRDIQSFMRSKEGETAYEKLQRHQEVQEILLEQQSIFHSIGFYTTLYSIRTQEAITDSPILSQEQIQNRMKQIQVSLADKRTELVWLPLNWQESTAVIPAARFVIDSHTGKPGGLMIFDFPETILEQSYQNYCDSGEIFFLFRGDGVVLSSNNKTSLGKPLPYEQILKETKGYTEGYFYLNNQSAMVSFVKNETSGIYLAAVTPAVLILKPFQNIYSYLLIIVLLIMAAFFLLTTLLSQYMARPLRKLTNQIRTYRNENPMGSDLISDPRGMDEITYLSYEYSKMMDRINSLIWDIYQEQEQKRDYEVQALQGQINPHFLYNTLHSIRYLNLVGEKEQLDLTIQALVRMLSDMFQKKNSDHTIQEEIEFLKDYVYIQQIRYGNPITLAITCKETLLDLRIARLLLQPLVENSIFHGISSYEIDGLLTLSFVQKQDQLLIQLEDNGIGLANSSKVQSVKKHGIGLTNVRERLTLLYGPASFFQIADKDDTPGALVTIGIPIERLYTYAQSNDCR